MIMRILDRGSGQMSKKPRKVKTKGKAAKHKRAHRGTPLSLQGIGVLSSIPFQNKPIQTAFLNGLATPGIYINVQDGNGAGLGYGTNALTTGLTTLNLDPNVGLIVAVGGSITHNAAMNDVGGALMPFISIVGGKFGNFPNPGNGHFCGSISLQSVSHHALRIAKIKALFNIAKNDEICLLYNTNAAMHSNEVLLLKNSVPVSVDENTVNANNIYTQAFNSISQIQNPTIKAVIVSADPWFTQTASNLVTAANNWIGQLPAQRAVCYCLQEYQQYNPTPGKRLKYGPLLQDVYKALGQMAKAVLADPTAGSNEDAADVIAT